MQPIYFNQGMSHKVIAKYVIVDKLIVNPYGNIEITLSDLDIVHGVRVLNSQCRYFISTKNYHIGANYSLANAFGAILNTQLVCDLTELIDCPCLVFIHQKNTPSSKHTTQLFDLMPLEWIGWKFEVDGSLDEKENFDESV